MARRADRRHLGHMGRLAEPTVRHSPHQRANAVRMAACVLVALAVLSPHPAAADEEAERALLRQSWQQACSHYDETTNWTARQACNLAWFRAHEKGVWQHNLNPHGPVSAGPSS